MAMQATSSLKDMAKILALANQNGSGFFEQVSAKINYEVRAIFFSATMDV
jgi:hypothetical protein